MGVRLGVHKPRTVLVEFPHFSRIKLNLSLFVKQP